MLTSIINIIKRYVIKIKHPELRSGDILQVENVRRLNQVYGCNGTVEEPISGLGKIETGYHGKNRCLADIFRGVELGSWAIDSCTMDWLWDFLMVKRPNTILEFGSGSSTCLFSFWMKHNNPSGIVISIEQSPAEAHKTSSRLLKHGLSNGAEVLAMDVDASGVLIIEKDKISQKLGDRKIDMLFIDGPAGPEGCRENTLIKVIPLLSSFGYWFLHDSYRRGELNIIDKWSKIEGVTTGGIVAYGNGLGMGTWCMK